MPFPLSAVYQLLGKSWHTLKDKDRDRDKDKDNETEKRKGGGEVKLYNTECAASISVDETHAIIAMTVGGKVVIASIPSNDFKIHESSEDVREGDTLADWLARNGKES